MNNKNNIYIYALIDPRNIKIKYIGATKNYKDRYNNHLSKFTRKNEKTLKNYWVNELALFNLKPILIILEITNAINADSRERYWINYFGKENLLNQTNGGKILEGKENPFYGKHHTEEHKTIDSYDKQGTKHTKNSSSKYSGVSYEKPRNKWRATMEHRGKSIFVGRYDNEIDAALAYNKKALEIYGSNAKLNIIDNIGE